MAELERLKQIKCFLFDMDGTINLGNTLIPGMDAFFKKLRSYGRDFYLVTNNSSKGHSHYVEKMRRMGIEVTRKNVLISSDAFVYYMQQVKPGASLYVLGTDLLKETIIKGGFKLTTLLEEKTDFVVVGFDMSLDYCNALLFQADAGGGGRGHGPHAGAGGAVHHVDGRNLRLRLQEHAARLGQMGGHILRDLALRRDGIAEEAVAAGADGGLGDGFISFPKFFFHGR